MGGKLAEGLREFVEQKTKTEREEFEDKLRELVLYTLPKKARKDKDYRASSISTLCERAI